MSVKKTLDDDEILSQRAQAPRAGLFARPPAPAPAAGEPIVTEPTGPAGEGLLGSEGRRSMLGALGTVFVGGAMGTVMSGCYRRAVVVGPRAPSTVVVAPNGGGCSGVTDSDMGGYADRVGCGRNVVMQQQQQCTGATDSDGGAYADRAGCGRSGYRGGYGGTGVTDSDMGAYADPAGNGRGGGGRGYSGVTDSDGGPYADPAGNGRGRYR